MHARNFTALVRQEGWKNIKNALGSVRRDLGAFVVSATVGGSIYWKIYGWDNAFEQVVSIVLFTLGPSLLLAVLVIVGSFLIAPFEVIFEAVVESQSLRTGQPFPEPNYEIWKKRNFFSISELAALLDNVDPRNPVETNNQNAIKKLLIEEVVMGNLKEISGSPSPSENSEVTRASALSWAKRNGFDTNKLTRG